MKKYRIKVCGWNKVPLVEDYKRYDKGCHMPIVNFYDSELRPAKEYLNESLDNRYWYKLEVYKRIDFHTKEYNGAVKTIYNEVLMHNVNNYSQKKSDE